MLLGLFPVHPAKCITGAVPSQDPGNLESDLQLGAAAGYSLLWLMLWSIVMVNYLEI